MSKTTRKERTTKEQWLTKGLELFSREGVNGLKIERLSKQLGVAKSSFYWHFKDRDDLLNQFADHWVHETTEVLSANPLLLNMPPRERLLTIMTMIFEHDLAEFDLSFRAWGNLDPSIARKIRKAIKVRLDFVRQALTELGFKGDDLEMRARLFVAYQSNERDMFGSNKKTAKLYREIRLDLLLTPR